MLEKINKWVVKNGYVKLYKVGDLGYESNPPHSVGLPPAIYVKCKWTDVDGIRACFVTPTHVIVARLLCPYLQTNWSIAERKPYDSTEELSVILDQETKEPTGCW